MKEKTCLKMQEQDGYEGFEQLVERGRQLHDQAVFELFARMVSYVILSIKKCCGVSIRDRSRGLSIKQSSQIPV